MAASNIKFSPHHLHAFLQQSKTKGFWIAVGSGSAICAILITLAAYQNSKGANLEREATLARLAQTKATIAKLKAEEITQSNSLTQLTQAPITAQSMALNAGGYSEEDVTYWRKQMDAFSLMSGVRLTITGRGASQFKKATKLIVSIGPNGAGAASTLASADLIKALDFLQLYGYVESFNGTEAVLHITEKNT